MDKEKDDWGRLIAQMNATKYAKHYLYDVERSIRPSISLSQSVFVYGLFRIATDRTVSAFGSLDAASASDSHPPVGRSSTRARPPSNDLLD